MADAVIIEQFSEFVLTHQSEENTFIFVTHNHNDFSSKDHRKPHEDLSDIFDQMNTFYFNNLPSAIAIVDDEILTDIQFEYDFTEETRGLREILSAMDELFDKIWYNRHQNLRYSIENDDIRVLGRLLQIKLGMKWCCIQDTYGQDVSMAAFPADSDCATISFPPFSYVEKRKDVQNVEVFVEAYKFMAEKFSC